MLVVVRVAKSRRSTTTPLAKPFVARRRRRKFWAQKAIFKQILAGEEAPPAQVWPQQTCAPRVAHEPGSRRHWSCWAAAGSAAGLLGCLFLELFFALGMGWGGDRSRPGGNKPGRKPRMDDESIAKRAKRQASKARTAQRKAAKAAAAVVQQQAEKQKAVMREKHVDQVMCIRAAGGAASASPTRRQQPRSQARRQKLPCQRRQLPSPRRAPCTASL